MNCLLLLIFLLGLRNKNERALHENTTNYVENSHSTLTTSLIASQRNILKYERHHVFTNYKTDNIIFQIKYKYV